MPAARDVGYSPRELHRIRRAVEAEQALLIKAINAPRGISVHWPDVDEDIAIWDVLGIAEDAYLRSLREAPVG